MRTHIGRPLGALACVMSMAWAPGHAQTPAAKPRREARVAAYSFDVIREYRRAMDAYTQGLVFHGGRLYEGTGLYGESVLRETVLENGVQKVLRSRLLPDGQSLSSGQRGFQDQRLSRLGYPAGEIGERQSRGVVFGEGITVKGGLIYQLTWVEGICFVWDLSNWNTPARIFKYSGEGWGLTHDGRHLIMSDGSAALTFRDPRTFKVVKTLQVHDPRTRASVTQLNELEYVDGKIYANIYQTRRLAIIDARTGTVEAYVLFDGQDFPPGAGPQPTLMPRAAWNALDLRGDVLNGVARDPASGRFFVTGKKWPAVYEITLRKVLDSF